MRSPAAILGLGRQVRWLRLVNVALVLVVLSGTALVGTGPLVTAQTAGDTGDDDDAVQRDVPPGCYREPSLGYEIVCPSVSISASPADITVGDNGSLNWSSSWTTSQSINNGIGSVQGTSGTVTAPRNDLPHGEHRYTITGRSPAGSHTDSTTFRVHRKPEGGISADPTSICPGISSRLSWWTRYADDAKITALQSESVAASHSVSVRPSSDTTYTLTAKNRARWFTLGSATVMVKSASHPDCSDITPTPTATPEVEYPSAPRNPSASRSGISVTLSWSAPSDDGGAAITRYSVEQQIPGGTWTAAGSPSGTSHTVGVDLSVTGEWKWRIAAHNSRGRGAWAEVSITISPPPPEVDYPSAPRNPSASRSGASVTLSWSAPSDDGGATITRYSVEQKSPGGSWTGAGSPSGTSHTVGVDLSVTGEWKWRIAANNSRGRGPWAEVSITISPPTPLPTPPAPRNLTAGTVTRTSVPLSWDVVANTTKYLVQYRESGTTDWTTDNSGLTAGDADTTVSHTVEGLTCGTNYEFGVSAYGDGTTHLEQWGTRATTSATTGGCVPGQVTGRIWADAPTIDHASSTMLRWETSNATSVSIDQGIGTVTANAEGSRRIEPPSRTTYTLTATGEGGPITRSVTINVRPEQLMLLGVDSGDGELTLRWEAFGSDANRQATSRSNTGLPSAQVQVQILAPGESWSHDDDFATGAVYRATVTEHTFPGLDNDRTYVLRGRRLFDVPDGLPAPGAIAGAWSDVKSGTPRTATPGKVTTVVLTSERIGEVNVSWSAPSGNLTPDGYDIQWRKGTNGTWASHWNQAGDTDQTIDRLDVGAHQVRVRACVQSDSQQSPNCGGWAGPYTVWVKQCATHRVPNDRVSFIQYLVSETYWCFNGTENLGKREFDAYPASRYSVTEEIDSILFRQVKRIVWHEATDVEIDSLPRQPGDASGLRKDRTSYTLEISRYLKVWGQLTGGICAETLPNPTSHLPTINPGDSLDEIVQMLSSTIFCPVAVGFELELDTSVESLYFDKWQYQDGSRTEVLPVGFPISPRWPYSPRTVGETNAANEANPTATYPAEILVSANGFDVVKAGRVLLYIKRSSCTDDDVSADRRFFLNVTPVDANDLPVSQRQSGHESFNFDFADQGIKEGDQCVVVHALPAYAISGIETGQYDTDSGERVWQGTNSETIEVIAPVFGAGSYQFTVSESAAPGEVVGSVAATLAHDTMVAYGITEGNEDGALAIDIRSGAITVAGALDYETTAAYTLTVAAGEFLGGTTTTTVMISVTDAPEDYDVDDDGLIEVADLAQLHAIRWDLDGDGTATDPGYAQAFPDAMPGMGCPATGCVGYELTADLDFDADDAYWNGGLGWEPIGSEASPFTAVFDGNGHTIANLFIDRSGTNEVGLFGRTRWPGTIRRVGLPGVDVTGGYDTGSLVGWNSGRIEASYASGRVASARAEVGGLVGWNERDVAASYAAVDVTGGDYAGGLVGGNHGAVTASYATGAVTGGAKTGGLAGWSDGQITASYATGRVTATSSEVGGLVGSNLQSTVTASYWDTTSSGQSASAAGAGQTTGALQMPTGYGGIYAEWNVDVDGVSGSDDPWHFGTPSQYPVLQVDFDGDGTVTWQEFGEQRPVVANRPPVFAEGSTTTRAVAEHTAAGEDIGEPVMATDPDAGDVVTYALGGRDAVSFDLVRSTGQLQTNLALDYERQREYEVTITARDDHGGSSTITVTIQVEDVADTPTFQELSYEFPVREDAAVGAAVGTVTATPAGGGALTYALTPDPAAGPFAIDGSSGQLTVAGALAASSYALTVNATEAGGGTATVAVTITVTAIAVDYDRNDDGLIEVASLAQLHAIRWDLDGDGTATDPGYARAFPDAMPGDGLPGDGLHGLRVDGGPGLRHERQRPGRHGGRLLERRLGVGADRQQRRALRRRLRRQRSHDRQPVHRSPPQRHRPLRLHGHGERHPPGGPDGPRHRRRQLGGRPGGLRPGHDPRQLRAWAGDRERQRGGRAGGVELRGHQHQLRRRRGGGGLLRWRASGRGHGDGDGQLRPRQRGGGRQRGGWRVGGLEPGHDRGQLCPRRGDGGRRPRRRPGRVEPRRGHGELLGHDEQRAERQRRGRGPDDRRAAGAHRLWRHLRGVERGQRRRERPRRPVALRHGERVSGAPGGLQRRRHGDVAGVRGAARGGREPPAGVRGGPDHHARGGREHGGRGAHRRAGDGDGPRRGRRGDLCAGRDGGGQLRPRRGDGAVADQSWRWTTNGKRAYEVTITASDDHGGSTTITVTIQVEDVADTPVFAEPEYGFPVREDAAVGAAVGTVTATPAGGGALTYLIAAGNTGDAFAVDPATGALTVAAPLDYLTTATYTLTVSASVGTGTADVTVTMAVTGVDCANGTVIDDPRSHAALVGDCRVLLAALEVLEGDASLEIEGGGTLDWSDLRALAQWEGVTTGGTPRRVTGLELADKSLGGEIPSGLGSLTALTTLDLSANRLTGAVPAELSGLTALTTLRLSGNRVGGCLPTELRALAAAIEARGGAQDLAQLALAYCDATAPAAPTDLAAAATTATSITLSWVGATDAGTLTYRVEYRVAGHRRCVDGGRPGRAHRGEPGGRRPDLRHRVCVPGERRRRRRRRSGHPGPVVDRPYGGDQWLRTGVRRRQLRIPDRRGRGPWHAGGDGDGHAGRRRRADLRDHGGQRSRRLRDGRHDGRPDGGGRPGGEQLRADGQRDGGRRRDGDGPGDHFGGGAAGGDGGVWTGDVHGDRGRGRGRDGDGDAERRPAARPDDPADGDGAGRGRGGGLHRRAHQRELRRGRHRDQLRGGGGG